MESITLKVDGMSCEHCVKAVSEAVQGVAGTANVSVDLKNGTVSFSYDSSKTQLDAIKAAITEEDFTVS